MKRFLTEKAAFTSVAYARDYRGPVLRGNHPLPHQSQSVGRDLFEHDLRKGYVQELRGCVLSDEDAANHYHRAHGLPYSYIICHEGRSYTAFFTHEDAQNWASAYGLGSVPPIPAEGIVAFVLKPGGPMLPLRIDLSRGIRSPQDFALRLLEDKNKEKYNNEKYNNEKYNNDCDQGTQALAQHAAR